MKIAVFVSGSGTNLQAIINAIENEQLRNIEISAVIADRDCYGLERAAAVKIPTFQFERGNNLADEINSICKQFNIDLIVLAGFLSILPAEFCQQWNRKIINLHPSLLPKHGGKGMYGKKVHKAVISEGDKKSGATVHFVTAGVDEGEIILQSEFNIPENATVDWLVQKIGEIEKPLLLKAIQKLSNNKR